MSFKPNQNQTMYSEHVERCAKHLVATRGGAFTIKELAECMNMRVTHNLRKRVRSLVVGGVLDCHPYWMTRNEHGHFYTLHEEPVMNGELPF